MLEWLRDKFGYENLELCFTLKIGWFIAVYQVYDMTINHKGLCAVFDVNQGYRLKKIVSHRAHQEHWRKK
jgi:hypothetical protein